MKKKAIPEEHIELFNTLSGWRNEGLITSQNFYSLRGQLKKSPEDVKRFIANVTTQRTFIPEKPVMETIRAGIVKWLSDYCKNAGTKGFVIGVSGGIDSAVTSTLCAMTGYKIASVIMPIGNSDAEGMSRAEDHIKWLSKKHYINVVGIKKDLTQAATALRHALQIRWDYKKGMLALANTYSRLRMLTLYAIATDRQMLVCGTGNKVEDFGVGFFTKYGDGGVDLSPIGDLTKTQVRGMAKHFGIIDSIQKAEPSDGLWEDGRTDEDQLGATYEDLEWAMSYEAMGSGRPTALTEREEKALRIYRRRHEANKHKMKTPPICYLRDMF